MNFLKEIFTTSIVRFRQFIVYAIIGATSAGLDFFIFTLLIKFSSIDYLIANVISVHCGIINSFLFNRAFNFKVTDKVFKRFLSFYTVGLMGLSISLVMLWFLVEQLNIDVIVSKLLVIFVVTILQFTLNKLITFKIEHYEK